MRTELSSKLLATESGQRANEILRSCVHCGFCNATCPTYQLTGDELDGPRGRIYLIKALLEEDPDTPARATQHLDRCLTCRACETTCPSGVAYGELAEIARDHLGPARPGMAGLQRSVLRWLTPKTALMRGLLRIARPFKGLLPRRLAAHIPQRVGRRLRSRGTHARKVLLLNGCAQQVMTPDTNEHLAGILDRHGVSVLCAPAETCCGSLDLHLGATEQALHRVRHNVDVLLPLLDDVEAVISTASGCGVTLKDYARLLAHDPHYADKAKRLATRTLDVAEYLAQLPVEWCKTQPESRVACHIPCSLQHGQRQGGQVEALLTRAGYQLVPVADSHLCCGSAGSYSLLQTQLADQLKNNKLAALQQHDPELIVSANVGCQMHLASASRVPVKHWIELIE